MAIGPTLREARQQKQLTTSQVAEMTRMKVQIVDDLENDDFHRIAATIYGKGFIKLYAELVELDPEPLIADYMEQAGAPQAPKLPKNKNSQPLTPDTTSQAEDDGIATTTEADAQEGDSPDDLFAYAAQKPKQKNKTSVASTPNASMPAEQPAPSKKKIQQWQEQLQNLFSQARTWVTRAIDAGGRKFTESGEHDRWIQRGLIALGVLVAILILVSLVRIIASPREAAPLPDDELILFVPAPEPFFE